MESNETKVWLYIKDRQQQVPVGFSAGVPGSLLFNLLATMKLIILPSGSSISSIDYLHSCFKHIKNQQCSITHPQK